MRFLKTEDFNALGNNSKFRLSVDELYSESNGYDYQLGRYQDLYAKHAQLYPDNVLLFSSPGRIEICGNHTDHNNGKVLCASITLDTIACVTPTNDNIVTVASLGYPAVKIDLNDLSPNKAEYGTSEALVRGVAGYLKENGYKVGGFYATTTSDVFKGAGVSSSACFEVLLCEIFSALFNNDSITPLIKVFASHCAESKYFGKPCGLMDQSAIAFGNVSYIDFETPSAPIVETIEWQFDDVNIVICNCGGDHCNLTPEYAAIRSDMEAVAKELGKTTLREVNVNSFLNKVPTLKAKFNSRQLLRAMHFFNENKRVVSCAKAIKTKSFSGFKKNVLESGHSSFELLQNCYVNGSLDQPIPLALGYMSTLSHGGMTCRVHGGGFAGTVIGFSNDKKLSGQLAGLKKVFGDENVHLVKIRKSGAKILDI